MYHISNRSNVDCAMVHLSKAYDKINASLKCGKMRENGLSGQVIIHIDIMGKDTFVCISYVGQLSAR